MEPPAQSDLLDSLVEAFADPNRRSSATHLAAARGPAAIPAVRAILDRSASSSSGASPCGIHSEPFRCALVTARLLGDHARPLLPLIVAAFRDGSGAAALEALHALAAIAPTDPDTAAILAEALAREVLVAAEASYLIVRLDLCDHPRIVLAMEQSPQARRAMNFARR